MIGRHGVTLIEMLVALALLSVLTSIVALGLPAARVPASGALVDSVAGLRRRALASGRVQTTVVVPDSSGARRISAMPDGRVIADTSLAVDMLTGRIRAPR
jgi:prepilin-type N-terminal cleavage/methylation domain-containing protein